MGARAGLRGRSLHLPERAEAMDRIAASSAGCSSPICAATTASPPRSIFSLDANLRDARTGRFTGRRLSLPAVWGPLGYRSVDPDQPPIRPGFKPARSPDQVPRQFHHARIGRQLAVTCILGGQYAGLEQPRIWGLRIVQHRSRVAQFRDLATLHDDQPVGV